MGSYNKVILMGNLTRDPELRYTPNNMPICNVGLAVNRRFKDSQTGEWREEPTFIDVTIFGKRGEAFARYHQKGRTAFLEGSLRLDTWEDKNTGQKRSKLYVVADEWQFVGGRGEGGSYEPRAESNAQGGGYNQGYEGGGEAAGGFEPLEVDDTPF